MTPGNVKSTSEWRSYFYRGGHGYLSSANDAGEVDAAPYARPHVQDDGRWVFGMTGSRTLGNVTANPSAIYLFDEGNYRGIRVYLERDEIIKQGELLEEIRKRADMVVGPGTGAAVEAAVYFKVKEVRPLVGG